MFSTQALEWCGGMRTSTLVAFVHRAQKAHVVYTKASSAEHDLFCKWLQNAAGNAVVLAARCVEKGLGKKFVSHEDQEEARLAYRVFAYLNDPSTKVRFRKTSEWNWPFEFPKAWIESCPRDVEDCIQFARRARADAALRTQRTAVTRATTKRVRATEAASASRPATLSGDDLEILLEWAEQRASANA